MKVSHFGMVGRLDSLNEPPFSCFGDISAYALKNQSLQYIALRSLIHIYKMFAIVWADADIRCLH